MQDLTLIKQLIYDGDTHTAIRQLDLILQADPLNDEAFFLRGNAYRKEENIPQAINNYLSAMELNPESPAKNAYRMMIRILDFYNKDMYNH